MFYSFLHFKCFSQVSSNYVQRFIDVMSCLVQEQRDIVDDLKFSSLLKLSCSDIPVDLYKWLLINFDVTTKTLKAPNGFSFTFNAKVVERIFSIPAGGRPIWCKGSLEDLQFIQNQVPSEGPTPSVEELCALITPDLRGCEFARAFMLLALSSFLCPNTRGVCSTRYYSALTCIPLINQYDWCSFVLDWLLSYIRKYQLKGSSHSNDTIGGCGFLLVVCNETIKCNFQYLFFIRSVIFLVMSLILQVCYLEFLCTSEYNFGIQCPRIQFWSSTVVQSFAYLDSVPGLVKAFGRLQVSYPHIFV